MTYFTIQSWLTLLIWEYFLLLFEKNSFLPVMIFFRKPSKTGKKEAITLLSTRERKHSAVRLQVDGQTRACIPQQSVRPHSLAVWLSLMWIQPQMTTWEILLLWKIADIYKCSAADPWYCLVVQALIARNVMGNGETPVMSCFRGDAVLLD